MRTRVTASAQSATDVRFCLVFPRETISVPVMRQVLGETFRKLGLREDSIGDLLLAVTEACTNVLRHSGPGLGYEVVAAVGRDRCVLEVVDNGRGFEPAWLPARRVVVRSVSRFRQHWATPSSSAVPAPRAPTGPSGGRAAGPGPAGPGSSADGSAAGLGGPVRPGAVTVTRGPLLRVRRSAQHRAIARLPESGRGLAIMRAFVDDVTLRSRPGRGTVVWLAKQIELRSDAPLARAEAAALRDAG